MRASELTLAELLVSNGGVLTFGPSRALLLDAVALGWLRRELIDLLGITQARGLLTRLGYAHGVRTAEATRGGLPWDHPSEHQRAGIHLARLMGFARIAPAGDRQQPEAVWHESYEAEQHLLHLGRADQPVCWTLCGFASGWFSAVAGVDNFFLEERCAGQGEAVCHVIGRTREQWGPARAEQLRFFESEALDETVAKLGSTLRSLERRLRDRRAALVEAVGADPGDEDGVLARSPAMRRALQVAQRAALVDVTVLITGESGTGKELLARALHRRSSRAHGPFVAINCGALTETLLESELFGHRRGAFTGAHADRPGLLEAASGGTLFLDEVGEMPLSTQVKLLRALQEREVRRVGENHPRPIDVRILAATHRVLADEIASGRFREDLYYRLKVVEVQLPPLRERREDLLPLGRRFLAEAAERMGRRPPTMTPAFADALTRHPWPGNVRELQNAIERAVALAEDDRLDPDDLPPEMRGSGSAPVGEPGTEATLEEVERGHVLAVLERNEGHRRRTARELGIGIATLYRMLRRWGAPPRRSGKRRRSPPRPS